MQPEIAHAVQELLAGRSLAPSDMTAAIGALMDGRAGDVEIAALLTALAAKGESADEIAGAATAMRARVTRVPATTKALLDTCGTGGDRLNTFNISTATALVVASAEVPIAKHGNRSATSTSGSAEVLESLGVRIELLPDRVARCIDQIGIGFCYARLLHSAMKHVGPVRTALGFRTIFNLLGPLTNPAGAEFQLIGANRTKTAAKLARAVASLGTRRTVVVCGNDQIDEVALWGTTEVLEVVDGRVIPHVWTAKQFELPECNVASLRVQSPAQSAAVISSVLAGDHGPARDMVVANAAAAFWCVYKVEHPAAGARLAEECIDSGKAKHLLSRLVAWTNDPISSGLSAKSE
jgi:anthranilate phosphoribosyltransferase